jgi:hypothetical protein
MQSPVVLLEDPNGAWLDGNPITNDWRERERRQRTIRLLMMFLFMLLLMDDDPPSNGSSSSSHQLRGGRGTANENRNNRGHLDAGVFHARRAQDGKLMQVTRHHPRYRALVERNQNRDVQAEVLEYAEQQALLERDLFGAPDESTAAAGASVAALQGRLEDMAESKVRHFPWNATGFYRGDWSVAVGAPEFATTNRSLLVPAQRMVAADTGGRKRATTANSTTATSILDAVEIEDILLSDTHDVSVRLLPEPLRLQMRNDNNLTTLDYDRLRVDSNGKLLPPPPEPVTGTSISSSDSNPSVTLTRDSGRAAFQLVSRSVPGLWELSLVHGFVKLYDSTSPGYSTRKDILLRVHGVMLHSIGRLSLVGNVGVDQMALVIPTMSKRVEKPTRDRVTTSSNARRRRLEESIREADPDMEQIRDDELILMAAQKEEGGSTTSSGTHGRFLFSTGVDAPGDDVDDESEEEDEERESPDGHTQRSADEVGATDRTLSEIPRWSSTVFPYPVCNKRVSGNPRLAIYLAYFNADHAC